MIEIVQLAPSEVEAWEDLTFPLHRPRLRGEAPGVALGARMVGQPVGLALATPDADAELLSVAVRPSWRGQGVAGRLLAALEEELLKRGCDSLQATYIAGQPSTAAVERLLARRGFAAPQPRMLVCRSEIPLLHQAPYVSRRVPRRAGEVVLWSSLGTAERNALRDEQAREPVFASWVTPFEDEDRIEPASSLALIRDGVIQGFMITHRVAPELVRYSRLSVRRGVPVGSGFGLAAQSIRLHWERLRGEAPLASVDFGVSNRMMVNFLGRHLRPYLTSVDVSKRSSKSLCSGAAPSRGGAA